MMRHRYLRPSRSLPEIYLYRAPLISPGRPMAWQYWLNRSWAIIRLPERLPLYVFTNRQRNKITCLM